MKEVTIEEFKELIKNPNESVIFRYVDINEEVKAILNNINIKFNGKPIALLEFVEYSADRKDTDDLCFRVRLPAFYGCESYSYYVDNYPNQIVKIINPEKTMKTKIVKQLENQVEVMQSLLDGKMVVERAKDMEEGGRFLKLESDNFTFLEKYPGLENKKDWEETRVLPNINDTNYNVFEVEEVEEQWYDNIPEHGVLCWVSDNNEVPSITIDIISDFAGRFINHNGAPWNYATPLTNEEISKFLR